MARSRSNTLKTIDPEALRARLDAVGDKAGGDQGALRTAAVEVLKEAMSEGREIARKRLEDGTYRGTECAAALCELMDTLVEATYDFAVYFVYRVSNPSQGERLAVAAMGGYGRGLMAPGSDVDLLFLRPYKQTAWGESVVEFVLYTLWDLGLKVGHATRTVAECVRLSKQDFTIRTALLEVRPICGEASLIEEMIVAYYDEVASGTANEFVEAKLAERDERHKRAGDTRYLVEPNVKDGKGGLRDLNTLFWIGKYVFQVREPGDLVKKGLLTKDEFKTFRRAENFLWEVRCHLHFLTGRAEERLTFDVQTAMSQRLGYNAHAGLKSVERFMKHYFLVAKDVGDLTRIFCAVLEEEERKKRPGFGRFMSSMKRKKQVDGFTIDNGRLALVDNDVFQNDPANLIRLFQVADKHQLLIHPDALKLVRRSLKLINADLRKDETANGLFLKILTSKKNPERALRMMNEAGVLGRFVPDFGRIVALMQFNMYHHYTADEHLIRAIGHLSKIEKGIGEEPFATEVFGTLKNRSIIYLAMFLHDIAKGRPEDHSIAGAAIAKKLGPRLGLNEADTETVAWLVLQHLLMSDVAQKRDISDPKTVRDFAEAVQNRERLKLLYILTCADIQAVGPGVWNAWKGQLLRQLYNETLVVLSGGEAGADNERRIQVAKAALRERLSSWPEKELDAYLDRHQGSYWLAFDTDVHARHADLLRNVTDPLVIDASVDTDRDVTVLTFYTQDHPGLFARFSGACSVLGLNTVDAKIFTTKDGMALDILWVQEDGGSALAEKRRIERLDETIRKVLSGDILAPDMIEQRNKRSKRVEAFSIAPEVSIDNDLSDDFSVIEVNGLDRPGLLHALTRALFHLGLSIGSAQIATYGERAVDTFYVKDALGQKVTNANKRKAIEKQLTDALKDPMGHARPKGKAAEKISEAAE